MFNEILVMMLFMGIVDDFYLQPIILSKLKQKKFWLENAPDKQYRYDHIMAGLIHAFSWTVMILIPLWWYGLLPSGWLFVSVIAVNTLVHAYIDNMKANQLRINLWTDQLLHVGQILITWLAFTMANFAGVEIVWTVGGGLMLLIMGVDVGRTQLTKRMHK